MKKTKLLLSLAMMCLSIAVLCFGVLAATSVTYTISGTISYEVKDAYVEITTKKYTTTTEYEKASDLRTAGGQVEAGTLSLGTGTQVGTTYNTLNETGTKENSGLALTYDLSSTTKVRTNWLVTEVKNLSDAELYVKVIDDHELDFYTTNSFIYRTQDVTSLAGKGTTKIVIGFTLWDETTQIDNASYGVKLEVGLAENYSPLKYQEAQTKQGYTPYSGNFTKSAYYYVEMGDYFGLPVRWRLIAEKDTSSSKSDGSVAGVYKYDDTKKYKTISTATQEGLANYRNVDGIFLQETMTVYEYVCYESEDGDICEDGTYNRCYDERTDGDWIGLTSCSFNGYKSSNSVYYKTDDSGNIVTDSSGSKILANDYYNSRIREYLNGTDVNKYMESSGVAHTGGHTSNYLTDLNISTSNNIYSKISARTSMEIKTGKFTNVWTPSTTDYGSGKTTEDKFWLPSVEEMLTWVAGVTTSTAWDSDVYNKMCWDGYNLSSSASDWAGAYAWLRSGSSSASSVTYNVRDNGDWNDGDVYGCDCGARAAFNFALGD